MNLAQAVMEDGRVDPEASERRFIEPTSETQPVVTVRQWVAKRQAHDLLYEGPMGCGDRHFVSELAGKQTVMVDEEE